LECIRFIGAFRPALDGQQFRVPMGAQQISGILPAGKNGSADETSTAPDGGTARLVRGSWSPCIQIEPNLPGKTLNGAQPGRIKNLRKHIYVRQTLANWILAASVMLSLAGCEKEQKTVVASTNAPTGNVDKLKEQARNAVPQPRITSRNRSAAGRRVIRTNCPNLTNNWQT